MATDKNFIVKNGLEVGGQEVISSSGLVTAAALGGQTLGTTDSPTFANTTLTGSLRGPATFTIDPAAVGDNTGTLVIAGNLQVDGTTTTINSTTMEVDDLNITLASGAANAAAANGAGITVDGASATITYDSTNDEWDFNKDINVTGAITSTSSITGTSLDINGNAAVSGYLNFDGGSQSGLIRFNGENAIGYSNEFLYINPSNHFTSGVYINSSLKVDGGLIGSYNEDLQLRTASTTVLTLSNTDSSATFAGNINTTGDITVGDSHYIGNQDPFDNLLLLSSSGENIVMAAAGDIYLNTNATSTSSVGNTRVQLTTTGTLLYNGTQILDGSRNFTNLGTISSGAITSTGNITSVTTGTSNAKLIADGGGAANVEIDRGSTSYHNNLLYRTAGAVKWRIWQSGADNILAIRNEVANTDVLSFTDTNATFAGTVTATGGNSTQWNTAYGWGNHASAGYITGNQTITLSGDVSGSGTTSINVTVADDSHNHVISNIDGLQTALDAKLASSSYTAADVLTKIKTVDGAGSGLDADLLDGISSASFLRSDANDSATGTIAFPSGISSDGIAKFYTWRAIDNTSSSSNQFYRIARITGAQSTRFSIELTGRSNSYGDGSLPAWGKLVGQLNNDNNFDLSYYNFTSPSEVVSEIGQVDVSTTQTDIYIRLTQFAEVAAIAYISDGSIITYGNNSPSTSAPTGYTSANTEHTMWHSNNDGSGSGLDADLLDGLHGSSYLKLSGGTMTGGIAMGNTNISGVNAFSFNDPGPNEGISWSGGSIKIYESPDDLTTNTAGNLQIVHGSTRRFTVNSTGVEVRGTFGAPATSGSSVGFISRFSQTSGPGSLDIGFGDPYSWLQSRASNNYATNYDLALNPNGGDVGIGTTSPSAKLHLHSDVEEVLRIDSGNTGAIHFFEGTTRRGIVGYSNGSSITTYADAGDMVLRAESGKKLHLAISGTPYVTVNSSGQTLINTTDGNMPTAGGNAPCVIYGGAGNGFSYNALHVGGGRISLNAQPNSNSTRGYIECSGAGFNIWHVDNSDMIFGVNNAEKMRIQWSDGRIKSQATYDNAAPATHRDVYVENSGQLGYASSVRAHKTNINSYGDASWLYQIDPKTFNYRKPNTTLVTNDDGFTEEVRDGTYSDTEYYDNVEVGFIAEDVEEHDPNLCFYNEVEDEDGNVTNELAGIHYKSMVVPMLKLIQELKAELDAAKARITELEG